MAIVGVWPTGQHTQSPTIKLAPNRTVGGAERLYPSLVSGNKAT